MTQLAALAFLSGHVRNGVIGTAQLARCASAIYSGERMKSTNPFYNCHRNARAPTPRAKYALSSRVGVRRGVHLTRVRAGVM